MKLNVNCPINTVSYGYVSSFFIKYLKLLGYDLRHIPIGQNSPDENLMSHINDVISRWDFHFDAPCLKIWHQDNLNSFTGSGEKIGFPIFELEDFKDQEKHNLKYPDRLFVCSEWAKQTVKNNGIDTPTHVVPLGYDHEIFKPCPLRNSDNETVVFANFGKFEIRKGHDILIEAFNQAFDKKDDVALIMMPHNYFLTPQEWNDWINKYKKSKLGDKVQIINRLKNQKMVYSIMKQCHCGVFPAKAEGWNLEALEMLAIGKHIIITNCTGHTEFCNDDNSMLIEMDSGYEKAVDNKFFFGQGRWNIFAQKQKDQLIYHMRDFYKRFRNGEVLENKADVEQFTWQNSALKLDKAIKNRG